MGGLIDFNSISTVLQPKANAGGIGGATRDSSVVARRDTAVFGGRGVSSLESANLVVERAFNKLREVVGNARAELGIPEGAQVDTSAEATANRILDFALGAFERFRGNHPGLDEKAARQEFAQFIGNAIGQGIDEARGILGSLGALDGNADSLITSISDIIANRLDAFASGSE